MTQTTSAETGPNPAPSINRRFLFATCFVALVATSFAFIIRAMIIGDWADDFGLSETQKGELFGAGVWPFAVSIILFSLVIDRVGYGKALAFAFACHVASVFITINAVGYWSLYWGNFVAAIAAGTVEAAINPVVAAMFPRAKTRWLNILHAGWPGGLVLGGLLTLSLNPGGLVGQFAAEPISWHWKVGLLLIPTAAYGLMLLPCRFPVSERVAANIPYTAMLKEFGAGGALIAFGLVAIEVARVVGLPLWTGLTAAALIAVAFYAYVRTLGRWLFLFLLLVMILLATTELGTDAWIKELMHPVMDKVFGIDGGWVLVYTATIMTVLRLFAGPLVKLLNPLGMLAVSALFAAAGLAFLSQAQGLIIIAAATVYGIGQTFFWPTTLGLVAERFPKGGALTLNAIAGVGMLGVGVLGTALLGNIQDQHIDQTLAKQQPTLHAQIVDQPKPSVVGSYRPLIDQRIDALPEPDQQTIADIRDQAKQSALLKVAVLPLVMFACYLGLLIYFRSRGGYQALHLLEDPPPTPSA